MELADLCEGAFVTYLKGLQANGQSVWPASLHRGAGQNMTLRIFPGETGEEKDGQVVFCAAIGDFPEHIPSSAIYEVPMRVLLRTPTRRLAPDEAGAQNPPPDPVPSHQAVAEQLRAAVMAFGLEQALTAAQAGFTCFGILGRQPTRAQTEDYWESGYSLTLVCCGAAFPN